MSSHEKNKLEGIVNYFCRIHPVRHVVLGYLAYILIGWALLCLPFMQRSGSIAHCLDHLFISTSAVSTTGLVTVSISGTYNLLGQIIVLVLIQLGGIGYMTFGSFIFLARSKPLSKIRMDVANAVFTLPESFKVYKFIKSVITFTALIETTGAVLLYIILKNKGVDNALWSAIFHSVSSFCTAGFSLYDNSFENFSADFSLNIVIAALSYLGAVGFIVFVDVWRKLQGKIERVTLTTKIILWATFYISIIGTFIFFITEPSIRLLPADKRLLASFFQTMTAMTTVGFNTIPVGAISRASLLLLTTLMVIGASPSGTGGGLKSTTFSALWGLVKSTLKGQKEVSFWGRIVPEYRVRLACATLCFYVTFLLIGTYFLSLCDDALDFEKLLFEAASALGTVGLSTGITSSVTTISKVILISLMYAGRLGPLTFGLSMFVGQHGKTPSGQKQPDDLVI
ncbi:MAG: potassium transporter TrkG [Phycisphaerae bacterium]|nr:potassium transporter TrkG [Phycisphaerae bacterium]MDD5381002.1 potassium transporter TrkG [Phycisphaerae bacterium]